MQVRSPCEHSLSGPVKFCVLFCVYVTLQLKNVLLKLKNMPGLTLAPATTLNLSALSQSCAQSR